MNETAKKDQDARGHLTRLAAPAVNSTHQSTWSHFDVTLPSGIREAFIIPLAAAVAIEEAGFTIVLVGRLN